MRTFFLLVLLVACQGKEGRAIDQTTGTGGSAATSAGPAPSLTDSYDKALVDLDALKTKMCACTDVVCTDKVFAEFTAWRMELKKSNAGKKPTPDQDKKGNALDRAMKQCRAQVAADVAKKDAGLLTGSGAAANPVDAALAEMETWKKKMCECRDKACADKLQAEFATWQRLLRAKMTEKPTTLQEVRGNAIDKEMKECRKKAEAGTPGAPNVTSKIDNMLTEMQTFRDKICACTTKACGDGVGKEMEAWQTKVGKELADAKPTKDQDDKADRLAAEMKTCLGKLK